MKTRKIVLEAGQGYLGWYGNIAPGNNREEICPTGLRKHADVPEDAKSLTITASDEDPDNNDCWDIRPSGCLVGVGIYLDCDFQSWLRRAYTDGLIYMTIAYEPA